MNNCRDVEPLMVPYVDGEAAPAERAAVAAHIDACGGCRDDLAAQQAARDVLQARRDELRACASPQLRARCAAHAHVPSDFVRTPQRSDGVASAFRRKIPFAAAATILLAVAAVFGLGLNNRVQALALQMTLDHVKCTRFNSAPAATDAVAAAQRWSAKFGWPLTVPASSEAAGLELRAVRRCAVTDGRVAHLIYQWRGQPLSVYVLPSRELEQAVKVKGLGHESVMWSSNGRTYVVLASASNRPAFEGVVQYVRANVY